MSRYDAWDRKSAAKGAAERPSAARYRCRPMRPPRTSPEKRIEYDRKSGRLDAAYETLSPRCREVFALTMEDMPVGEIATRLGISDRMVRKHLALAMQLPGGARRKNPSARRSVSGSAAS
jgi:RNA polymerase sigma factor (sigma-70 family)